MNDFPHGSMLCVQGICKVINWTGDEQYFTFLKSTKRAIYPSENKDLHQTTKGKQLWQTKSITEFLEATFRP